MAEIIALKHEEERFKIENSLVSTGGEISEATQTPVTPEGVAELERLQDQLGAHVEAAKRLLEQTS
ncbi:MAG: hypothetical protein RID23_04480 [Roseovarius sp.]